MNVMTAVVLMMVQAAPADSTPLLSRSDIAIDCIREKIPRDVMMRWAQAVFDELASEDDVVVAADDLTATDEVLKEARQLLTDQCGGMPDDIDAPGILAGGVVFSRTLRGLMAVHFGFTESEHSRFEAVLRPFSDQLLSDYRPDSVEALDNIRIGTMTLAHMRDALSEAGFARSLSDVWLRNYTMMLTAESVLRTRLSTQVGDV